MNITWNSNIKFELEWNVNLIERKGGVLFSPHCTCNFRFVFAAVFKMKFLKFPWEFSNAAQNTLK